MSNVNHRLKFNGLLVWIKKNVKNIGLAINKPLKPFKMYISIYKKSLLSNLKPKHTLGPKTTTSFLQQTFFLKSYFMQNERIWQEGLLIDFLQKKVIDKWTRNFLITSSYLVNERLFFDWVVRFYMELVLWPSYRNRIFEFLNIGSTLFITTILLLSTILLLTFPYILITLFL